MSQENVRLVEEMYAAIERGDLDGFLALAHPEIRFRSLIMEAEGRTLEGHDGVREWWAVVIDALNTRPNAEQIEGFRDRGIARLQLAGNVGGVQVSQTMWMSWRVRDGQVIWWATFRTEAEALDDVGLS